MMSRTLTSPSRRISDLLSMAVLCIALGQSPMAWAQSSGPLAAAPISSILTLNQDVLFARSELGQRIIAELERDRTALAAENRRIETELAAEEQALTERRAALSPAEFSDLAQAFDDRVQRLRQAQDRKSRVLQERLDAERRSFTSKAAPIIATIARERGAVMVLDNTVVLLAVESVDITSEVIARLNRAIGDGRSDLGTGLPEQSAPTPPDTQQDP